MRKLINPFNLPMVRHHRCPTPRKRSYRRAIDADLALIAAATKHLGDGRPTECRVYRCTCGMFHLTSKAQVAS